MKKSPAKAPFPFSLLLSIRFQYVSFSHTYSFRFHPLTRFIFVYVIRKKKKEKLYTELVEFPFSLDYTNSNLFNFSLFSLLFKSLSLLLPFLDEFTEHIPYASLHDIKEKECDGSWTCVWGWFGYDGAC